MHLFFPKKVTAQTACTSGSNCFVTQVSDTYERLSEGFHHVRVDLYNVMPRIYFGELTFYDGSGYMKLSPDSFDFAMGENLI